MKCILPVSLQCQCRSMLWATSTRPAARARHHHDQSLSSARHTFTVYIWIPVDGPASARHVHHFRSRQMSKLDVFSSPATNSSGAHASANISGNNSSSSSARSRVAKIFVSPHTGAATAMPARHAAQSVTIRVMIGALVLMIAMWLYAFWTYHLEVCNSSFHSYCHEGICICFLV